MNLLKTKNFIFVLVSFVLIACKPPITTNISPKLNKPEPNYVKDVYLNLQQNGPFISGKIEVTFANQSSKLVKGNYHFSLPENSIIRNYQIITEDDSLYSTLELSTYISDILHSNNKGISEIAKFDSVSLRTNGQGYFEIKTRSLPPETVQLVTATFHSLAQRRGEQSGIQWHFDHSRDIQTIVQISTPKKTNFNITHVWPDSNEATSIGVRRYRGKMRFINITLQSSTKKPTLVNTQNGQYPAYIIPRGIPVLDSLLFDPSSLFEFYPKYIATWKWVDTLITESQSGMHAPFIFIPSELSSRDEISQPFINYLIKSKHIPIFQDITSTNRIQKYSTRSSLWMQLDHQYQVFYDPNYLILPKPLWESIAGQAMSSEDSSATILTSFQAFLKYNVRLATNPLEQKPAQAFPPWKQKHLPAINNPVEKILWNIDSQKQRNSRWKYEQNHGCVFYDSAPEIVGGLDYLKSQIQLLPRSMVEHPTGVVVIQVHVRKDSSVAELVPLKSPDPMLTLSAIQALRSVKVTPAMQRNRPVGIWFSVPVMFKESDYAKLSDVRDKIYHFFDRSFVIAPLGDQKILVEKGININSAQRIRFLSDDYFQLLYDHPEIIKYCYYAHSIGLHINDGETVIILS